VAVPTLSHSVLMTSFIDVCELMLQRRRPKAPRLVAGNNTCDKSKKSVYVGHHVVFPVVIIICGYPPRSQFSQLL